MTTIKKDGVLLRDHQPEEGECVVVTEVCVGVVLGLIMVAGLVAVSRVRVCWHSRVAIAKMQFARSAVFKFD